MHGWARGQLWTAVTTCVHAQAQTVAGVEVPLHEFLQVDRSDLVLASYEDMRAGLGKLPRGCAFR